MALAGLLPAPQDEAAQNSPSKCVADHYRLIPLPLAPASLNDLGQIAGTSAKHRAALWSQESGLHELGLPFGFTRSEAVAIDNSGDVAGTASNASSSKRIGFLFRNGNQATLSGREAKPSAINDAVQIAGESVDKNGVAQPALWNKTHEEKMGACCGGTAIAINNAGQVVGQRYDQQGRYSAFLWDSSHGMQPIGPAGYFTSAVAINNRGDVVVRTFSSDGTFLIRPGQAPVKLALSPKFPSEPRALNSCGAIVGATGPFSDAYRAFVWDDSHGFRDLNQLLPTGTGWKLEIATDINNRGEIVGTGDHNGEEDAGFLLVPEW
jgi:probable HAF family extracellular repeat protein